MCVEQRGMTLIEMVLAIVILAVGITGVLSAFTSTVRASADPMVRKQLLAIAEEMLEEALARPHAGEANPSPANACARDTFNDVRDYHGYAASGICDIEGEPVPALAAYAVTVTVESASLQGVSDALKVTVRASHGNESLSLVGWRTDFAGGAP